MLSLLHHFLGIESRILHSGRALRTLGYVTWCSTDRYVISIHFSNTLLSCSVWSVFFDEFFIYQFRELLFTHFHILLPSFAKALIAFSIIIDCWCWCPRVFPDCLPREFFLLKFQILSTIRMIWVIQKLLNLSIRWAFSKIKSILTHFVRILIFSI